jgi:flagellar motor switch protein FliN
MGRSGSPHSSTAGETIMENTNGNAAAPAADNSEMRNLEFLLDVPLQVTVEVGRTRILIKELLQMREGYVLELDKAAGETLDVYVNQRLIARGEAVLVNDKFGLRLTDVVSPAERLEKLG